MGRRRKAREGEGDDVSACRCPAIQAADPLRHFTGCPLREPLPEGHPAAGSCVKLDPFAAEIAAEADRIEAEYMPKGGPLDVGNALAGAGAVVNGLREKGHRHALLARLAAWALVALRAEAREMAAKGGAVSALDDAIRRLAIVNIACDWVGRDAVRGHSSRHGAWLSKLREQYPHIWHEATRYGTLDLSEAYTDALADIDAAIGAQKGGEHG